MKRRIFLLLVVVLCLCACQNNDTMLNMDESNNSKMYLSASAHSKVSKGNEGYYFVSGKRVYYTDNDLNDVVPLCNKANCLHNPMDINSAFNCNAYSYNDLLAPYVVEDYIYVVGSDSDTDSIYKMNIDGSGSEKWLPYYEISEQEAYNEGSICYNFSDDYCYYAYSQTDLLGVKRNYILQIELKKGAKPEVFIELPYENQTMWLTKIDIGENFMAVTAILPETEENYACIIDLNSGQIEHEIEGVTDIYLCEDGFYTLETDRGVVYRSYLEDQEEVVISINSKYVPYMGINKNYIFIDWSRVAKLENAGQKNCTIDIYSYDGKLMHTVDTSFIDDDTITAPFCSDNDYLFVGEIGQLFYDVYAIDLNCLEKNQIHWKKIDILNSNNLK